MLGPSWAWARRIWGHLGHRSRHWLLNIAIGIVIELILIALHSTPVGDFARNWAFDAAMTAYEGFDVRGGPSLPVGFIDIDEETWRNSGETPRAPRSLLSDLIKYSFSHDARYVVLDVIVEGEDGTDREDADFADEISKLAPSLEAAHQHLLLVRTLREPLYGSQTLAPEIRQSPLDEALRDHARSLHAVVPYFIASADGILRAWWLWKAGCRADPATGGGHWEVLPSAQLLVATLAQQERPGQMPFPWSAQAHRDPCVVDLRAYAAGAAAAPKTAVDEHVREWLLSRPDVAGASAANLDGGAAEDIASRIFFKFRYQPLGSGKVWTIPARKIPKDTAADMRGFAGGLVVIGQSFEAARDQHMTPLGTMPGAMVLVNAVESMLDFQLLRPPAPWFNITFMAASIVLVGFIYAYIESTVRTLLTFAPLVLLLIGTNYLLLRLGGTWIDFATPLVAIWAHRPVSKTFAALKARIGRLRGPMADNSA
jgi:CHASE2 domain-containing sensor protein